MVIEQKSVGWSVCKISASPHLGVYVMDRIWQIFLKQVNVVDGMAESCSQTRQASLCAMIVYVYEWGVDVAGDKSNPASFVERSTACQRDIMDSAAIA
ncbi:hypothetical protein TNCV_2404141 [Trichonephila clavipes]|nr:hypothetical protein TNCV_2404141 [Trichonephila clavipes]